MKKFEIFVLILPEVKKGNDLAKIIVEAANEQCGGIHENDIIVVTSKVVSKARGYMLKKPEKASKLARNLAKITKN